MGVFGSNPFKRKTHEIFQKDFSQFFSFKRLPTFYNKKNIFQNKALFFKPFSQIKLWDFF